MITVQQLIYAIEAKNGYPLDGPQKAAINQGNGPFLIAAGPGTGKTEALVARCLKFICCDGVAPGSIILTTFTDKAARNLEDRLADAFLAIANQHPQIANVDLSSLRVGTLHGIANRILQEHRYTGYQNLRLLDDLENSLLLHRAVVGNIATPDKNAIQVALGYLFRNNPNPARWDWTLALARVFSRLVEDRIDINALQAAGGHWLALYNAYQTYRQALTAAYSCDFSHLLLNFQEFLVSAESNALRQGSDAIAAVRPPLTHVLVDEYQDTNPIQESIYLSLCDADPHNLTVVGDDDQSLYRFRGGTVECMVGFPIACQNRWGITPQTIYLLDNHRSDSDIVAWCNNYITSFQQMNVPNARIQGKPHLNSAIGRSGTGAHPAVGLIRRQRVHECASDFATLVSDLLAQGVIHDYSQCALLLRSTQNRPQAAGPYQAALEAQGIRVYNPRSRDFQDQPEIAQALGAFVRIVDPQLNQLQNLLSGRIQTLIQGWVDEYDGISPNYIDLANYVTTGANAVQNKGTNELVTQDLPTILYRIFAHEPFVTYQSNPEMDLRLSKLTRLFEAFCAQYRRQLRTSVTIPGQIHEAWFTNFYYGLSGYISRRGLDDDEDEDMVCPPGYFPIMTVHQAKGLEFDFVFVGNLGTKVSEGAAHNLEQDLRPFRLQQPTVVHTTSDASWHDEIRQHFVAYSRAKYALVLMSSYSQLRNLPDYTASYGGLGGGWVRQTVPLL